VATGRTKSPQVATLDRGLVDRGSGSGSGSRVGERDAEL
jgi:hypothetical protein